MAAPLPNSGPVVFEACRPVVEVDAVEPAFAQFIAQRTAGEASQCRFTNVRAPAASVIPTIIGAVRIARAILVASDCLRDVPGPV